MATYKKRGYKKPSHSEENLDNVNYDGQSTTEEVFNTLDESAGRTEEWVARNQKYILGGIGAVVLVVLAFLGYQQFILQPKEAEASNEMFFAQQYFDEAVNSTAKDSLYGLALNGADGKYGLLDIIDNYGGTKAANLAHYTAGMAYLNTQKYDEAIKYLQDFKSDDVILSSLAKGGIGDAFVQIGQESDALEYYEKAISNSDNAFTTPKFLFKAGVLSMEAGDTAKALKYFNRIKNEYSDSEEGRIIDIYIGKAEAL
ncbi:tetratricopeptide repeat protein [Joostella atrarenae]|uniref:Tetratricopeptide repeat protein n=1 Tax=Joostella atrarenae TaxID=679257 RepID=A0ABS9J353_9FLAO|nr:tetratricopeptide repeat protein [Joostella atrarenae]MCF8714844.1 tetratricopeptide repeat protein [Joostella atrarenae]